MYGRGPHFLDGMRGDSPSDVAGEANFFFTGFEEVPLSMSRWRTTCLFGIRENSPFDVGGGARLFLRIRASFPVDVGVRPDSHLELEKIPQSMYVGEPHACSMREDSPVEVRGWGPYFRSGLKRIPQSI